MAYLDVTLHDFIDKHNVLINPTTYISNFLGLNPNFHKTALMANHIFRAFSMAALCQILPFFLPVNIAICFVGSLFYRLTVEINCAYKFALPAFAGSLALPLAATAVHRMISGVAFASLSASGLTFISFLPLVAYVGYIDLTVTYDVEH